jgi:hypothetical protein
VLKDFLTIVPFALKFISRQNYMFSTCRRKFLDHSNLKRDEVTGEWRKLHSEELHNLYSSPNIIRQIKSRRMRWAGHVARGTHGRGDKSVQGFGGRARRKETTRKIEA